MEILSYFFSLRPGSTFSYYIHLIIIAVLVIAFALTLQIVIKKHPENRALKKLFGKLPAKMKWASAIILFLLAVRYENIPYFSMRVLLYATVLWLGWLFVKHVYLLIKVYPEERAFYFRHHQEKAANKDKKKTYTTAKKRK